MGDMLSQKLKNVPVPRMFTIRQIFQRNFIAVNKIPDIMEKILTEEKISGTIVPEKKIAITAGSRGIANIPLIIKCIVDFVKKRGAIPVIVPCMGSHAGATAKGQREMLKELGITEEYCECAIESSMDTVYIGDTEDGRKVYIDANAANADGIIVVNRVKPHTAFRGPYESGLMKMMAIGLGKQYGAEECHNKGFKNMAVNVPSFGKAVLKHTNILFGIAIVENSYDETCKLEALTTGEIAIREPELLKEAFGYMPRILVDSCDVLIVDKIGKNYSGGGMDPNITGTWPTPYGGGGIKAQRVAVLDVSDESHGNTHGIGGANATTRRLFEKINYDAMYMNGLTSGLLSPGKIPWILDSDKEAIQICLLNCEEGDPNNRRMVRISNSLHLEKIMLSEAYYGEVKNNPNIEILDKPHHLEFNKKNNLFD